MPRKLQTQGGIESAKALLKPKIAAARSEWEAAQTAYKAALKSQRKFRCLEKKMRLLLEQREELGVKPDLAS